MAKGTMNVVALTGNVGKEPEIRYAPSGKAVCNFTLATTDGWGDHQKTNWHNIVCFGKTAEFVQEYVGKGSKVAVSGSITYSSWEDKEGATKYKTEITANGVEKLDAKTKTTDQQYSQHSAGDQGFDPNAEVTF